MSAKAQTVVYLTTGELSTWLEKQAQTHHVLAPTKEGSATIFRPYTGGEPLMDRTRLSPKAAVMPTGEVLTYFSGKKDETDPGKLHIALDDQVGKNVQSTLIFSCRSCDARGLLALDAAYLKGPVKDPYYAARREKLVIMVQTCADPCPTCFCHWVGGGPDSPEGADITFTKVSSGYVLESHTDTGANLLQGLDTARSDAVEEASAIKKAARGAMEPAPKGMAKMQTVAERIAKRFDELDFWQDETAKCIACGACTYMCPTCQCFTITDEGDATKGKRLRSWDACMSTRFTLEASGHNPRMLKAARMRQRVSHKYCYSPKNSQIFSCTGCGRCVRYCPVSLDIREIVSKAIEK